MLKLKKLKRAHTAFRMRLRTVAGGNRIVPFWKNSKFFLAIWRIMYAPAWLI